MIRRVLHRFGPQLVRSKRTSHHWPGATGMPRELREGRASCGNRVLLLGRSETAAFTGAQAQRDQIAPINNKQNAILAAELGQWNRQSGSAAAVVP